jgi:dihydroorotate dehydrogenase (NAD+) catalytic subunit
VADPEPSLAVTLAPGRKGDPLALANPVIAASGTFGLGTELQRHLDLSRLGAMITPGIARATRPGRDRHGRISPAIIGETPAGLLIAERYPTIGLRAALRQLGPLLESRRTPVIANLPASDADQCVRLAGSLAEDEGFAAIELDLTFLESDDDPLQAVAVVRDLTERVRGVWPGPLLAKLPYSPRTAALSVAARDGGADALSLGGGFPGMASVRGEGHATYRPTTGRLVGPATKPLALSLIGAVVGATDLPVVAAGGITVGDDAVEFLRAGATAVQVGSASFVDPYAALAVADGIATYLRRVGETDVRNIIGADRRRPATRA